MTDKYYKMYNNYIKYYLDALYKAYNMRFNAVPTIYYNYSKKHSTIDHDEIQAGTYKIFSNDSGIKWNRIFMLPLFTTEEGNIRSESNEKGIFQISEISAIISNQFKIDCTEYDHVYFIDDINNIKQDNGPLYRVININYTSMNNDNYFEQIKLRTYNTKRNQIDNFLANNYIFLSPFNKIYRYNDAKEINKLKLDVENNIEEIKNNINDNYQSILI